MLQHCIMRISIDGVIRLVDKAFMCKCITSPLSFSWTFTFTSLLSDILKNICRNVDRPELCQISLYDFQKFLLMDQKVLSKFTAWQHSTELFSQTFVLTSLSDLSQESWASDLSRVREFLMGYMRGGLQPEPMLQLDEVKHNKQMCTKKL